MGLKIFKVIWFFSLLAMVGVFMYVYASLPDPVTVGEGSKVISKEGLFYMMLAILSLTNASVFAITRLFPEKDHDFKAWFYGLVVCTNLFFVVGLAFVSLYNSTEKFDYPRIGFIIYGSLSLLIGWSISWPIFRFAQRIFGKQTI
jgi:hypothetical protein